MWVSDFERIDPECPRPKAEDALDIYNIEYKTPRVKVRLTDSLELRAGSLKGQWIFSLKYWH